MKTIILLFLSLPFWLSAQDKIPTISSELSRLIIEYEQECYADSTKHEELKPCYSLVYPPCPGHSYDPPVYYWIHKDPDWLGFREFIKRREK